MRLSSTLLALAVLVGAVHADVPRAIHPRAEVFVVHVDADDLESTLSALAAIPAVVRHQSDGVHQALMLSDDPEDATNVRLLERWKASVAGEGVEKLIFIGDVPQDRRDAFTAGLGHPPVTTLNGDPVEVSRQLAALVESPESPIEVGISAGADVTTVANAAVAASSQGRALVFTRGRGETLDAVPAILAQTEVTTVCLLHKQDQVIPATFAAAHYRGVVADIPGKLAESTNQLDEAVMAAAAKTESIEKLEVLPPRDTGLASSQAKNASSVIDWLGSQGLDRPGRLETLMVFAKPRKWYFWGLGYSFDRQLFGSPLAPEKPGALVGRLPLEPGENLACLNRSTMHRVLSGTAGPPKSALMSFVAFEANHAESGSPGPWTDNFGVGHLVNEVVGIPGQEPGIHPMLAERGIEMTFNNGCRPSEEPRQDPLVQSSADGFYARLNAGAALFYNSSHGSNDAFYPFSEDRSIQADVDFSDPRWPSKRGRFTTTGRKCSSRDLDEQLGDINGTVAIFNSCLVANGNVGPNLLRHGARAVVASYISVSFDGAGWWGIKAMESLADGRSIGEATAFAYAHTSELFAAGLDGADHTLRYVVIGDPHAACW